jgi:rSAM/selenodomain-associated transferase 1
MNAGAARAQGDVLLFLHADTTLPTAGVERVLGAMQRGTHAWGRFDVRIDGRSVLLPLVAWAMNGRSRCSGIATGDQAMFVRRDAFDLAGGFPEQPLMEDIELPRRLLRAAGRPLRARVTTSGRRWDEHGALRTILAMWRLRLAYWCGAAPDALAARYPHHASTTGTAVLQVFTRAPVAGTVKTRLAQAIGPDEAAGVHVALVERTLGIADVARRSGAIGGIELWCEPDTAHPLLQAWAARHGAALHVQRGDDLGARMAHALAHALERGVVPVLVGTDCPLLDARHIEQAIVGLHRSDAVFLPAEDGGYALVGLRRVLPIFEGIGWGGSAVMEATRRHLRAARASWDELGIVWDVDRPEDLARWRALLAAPSAGR